MDDGVAYAPREEISQGVKRALLLNEHLLRRAWGVCYVALALSMFFSIFGVPIIGSLAIARPLGLLGTITMALAASGCALVAILWAFRPVRNAAMILQPEDNRAWSRLLGYSFLVPLWLGVNGIVVSTLILARAQVPLVDFLVHFGLALYVYYALGLSFAKRIPPEASIAIATLTLSSVSSIALLTVSVTPGIYALLWGATIIVWISSGLYARTRPLPEFEEERTGLE